MSCTLFVTLTSPQQARGARGDVEDAIFDGCLPFTRGRSLHLDKLLSIEVRER